MTRFSPQFLRVMVLIAVACAQVLGVRHAFVCKCSGAPKLTFWDHCDGPHGKTCHENDSTPHSWQDHLTGANTHIHALYKEAVNAVEGITAQLPRLQMAYQPMAIKAWQGPPKTPTVTVLWRWHLLELLVDEARWAYRFAHTISLRV